MSDRRITARVRVEPPSLAPLATAELAVVPAALELRDVSVLYGSHRAVRDVTLEVPEAEITAFIGPSGCGKTSLLRCLNRMNDELPSARHDGRILFRGADIDAAEVSATTVRRAIGMVFQRPNPFPKSIFENVAYAPRALGRKDSSLEVIVEEALQNAGLWDEVKDKLRKSALGLSGGQQQRLCIARALAVEPDVLLMDEPCSALDPLATLRIEELVCELKKQVTIVIVTHNLQQAARVADRTAFFSAEPTDNGLTTGFLVEAGRTRDIFTNPHDPRTDDYIAGRFG